jgi:uncharacterized alkaline shock family protein YloU
MHQMTTAADGEAIQRATERGTIEVAPQAIATLAGRAVAECPGVVGIADKHLRFGVADLLPAEHYLRGVDVRIVSDRLSERIGERLGKAVNERIEIDLYLVVEYGLPIAAVAHEAIERVKATVDATLGMPRVQVNVIIQGLRVSDPTP